MLINDVAAIALAQRSGVPISGTLGVLVEAVRARLLSNVKRHNT